jgi:hypothetical protein
MKKYGVKNTAELEDGKKKEFFDYIAARTRKAAAGRRVSCRRQKGRAEGVLDPSDPTAQGDADSERRARIAMGG